jgi:hypothetical protein
LQQYRNQQCCGVFTLLCRGCALHLFFFATFSFVCPSSPLFLLRSFVVKAAAFFRPDYCEKVVLVDPVCVCSRRDHKTANQL